MSEFWFSNLYYTEYTLTASDTPHNIRTQAIANGWNGTDPVHVKVNVTGNRGSTSTGTPAIQTGTRRASTQKARHSSKTSKYHRPAGCV